MEIFIDIPYSWLILIPAGPPLMQQLPGPIMNGAATQCMLLHMFGGRIGESFRGKVIYVSSKSGKHFNLQRVAETLE